MAEMHLDLCIQSTNHLLETVSCIKENIRILEVFLNSGLSTIDFNKPVGFISDDYSSSEGRGSVLGSNVRQYHHLNDSLSGRRHMNCCCMCHFRIPGADKENEQNRPLRISGESEATVSISPVNNTQKKPLSAPPTPRLNKTASLRREIILQQRLSRKNTCM